MNRQPPALLERLASRLLPRASREHVLGDLAERYSSPARYIVDAGRTIPFVVGSQFARSGHLRVWLATGAFQVAMVLILMGMIRTGVELARGVRAPQGFALATAFVVLFCAYLYRVVESEQGSEQAEALLRRIAKMKRRLKLSFVPGTILAAIPFFLIAAARLKTRTLPVFDGRQVFDGVALVILAVFLGVIERVLCHLQLRKLHRQLEQL